MTSEVQAHTDTTVESAKRNRNYETPELRHLGDVRSLTLGGSLGTGDSGNAGVQRF